jgi:hypothetical protein
MSINLEGRIPSTSYPINYPTQSSMAPSASADVPNMISRIPSIEHPVKPNWHQRSISYLDSVEKKLDQKIPNLAIQNKIDVLGRYIQKKFAPLNKFNNWLDSNGQGKWYQQLATFLAKLPVRAFRNIIQILYNIVKGIVYTAVHPLKSLNHLAKMLVNLAHELTKPETWSIIGAGMIGASAGQAIVTANPFALIGMGIGAAALVGGLTWGSIKAAVEVQQGMEIKAVKQHLWKQAKELPEPMLTGFVMGLIMGGIQRAIQAQQIKTFQVSNSIEAKEFADNFVKENHLPKYTQVDFDTAGRISIKWTGEELQSLKTNNYWMRPFTTDCTIVLSPDSSTITTTYQGMSYYRDNVWEAVLTEYTTEDPLKNIGIAGPLYPKPPFNPTLSQSGAAASISNVFHSKVNP